MSRRAQLWVAFAAVHLVVAVLGYVLPNQPMGDVYNVYEPWSAQVLAGSGIVGVTSAWVYPQLALVPMVAVQALAWPFGYTVGWTVFAVAVDAAAFALLVGHGRSRGRRTAAWFWLAFVLCLGPVGLSRLDGLTVPLTLAACLWLVGRPWLGGALLAVATWIKVWPAALLVAAFLAVRRRLAVAGGALLVSAATIALVLSAGGAANLFGFIADQADRGLQIEAPVSAYYLWRAALDQPGSFVYWARDILTFQVTGPEVDVVIAVMTPLLVLAVAAVAVLGAVQAWRGATFARLFPPLALALVLVFVVVNKVGSPQYVGWLVPPLAIGLLLDRASWWRPALLALGIALLTQVVYPVVYDGVIAAQPAAVAILTVRNILLVVLLCWMLVRLTRLRAPARRRSRPSVRVDPPSNPVTA